MKIILIQKKKLEIFIQVGFLSLSENLPTAGGGGTATLTATNILIGKEELDILDMKESGEVTDKGEKKSANSSSVVPACSSED